MLISYRAKTNSKQTEKKAPSEVHIKAFLILLVYKHCELWRDGIGQTVGPFIIPETCFSQWPKAGVKEVVPGNI